MRRLELEGRPGSFFEVAREGSELVVCFGQCGRAGRTQRRPFESEAAASAELDRLIAAHLEKGYADPPPPPPPRLVIVEPRVDPPPAAVDTDEDDDGDDGKPVVIERNPALEAACLESPDDPAPWSVYADWLLERGDPRGELAARHLAGDTAGAARYLTTRYRRLCGIAGGRATFEFCHGFATAATFAQGADQDEDGTTLEREATRLLRAPIAVLLTSLRFGLASLGGDNNWRPTLAAVTKSQVAGQLTALRFDNFVYDECMLSWAKTGNLTGLAEKLPRLEALHVRGTGPAVKKLASPTLKTFVRESCNLSLAELTAFRDADWPALDHLELWFGPTDEPEQYVEHLLWLLDGIGVPKLRHLGLINCDLHDRLIPLLASSKLLRQLDSLDLSKGTMAERETGFIVGHAPRFRHLAAFDLSENLLTSQECEQIRSVLDNVLVHGQRERSEDDRYVAEYE